MAKSGIPGHHHRRFRVDVGRVTGQEPVTSDGSEIRRIEDLHAVVTYNGDLYRIDGRWRLNLQWIDLENKAHKFALPHEVIARIITHSEKIMAEARRDRARAGAATRAANREEELDDELP